MQKAFDTVEHDILFSKLEHYGVRDLANEWFKSYQIENMSQLMVIILILLMQKIVVPQGSVLGPLLFLIYINDLNQALKFSKNHHFPDDANLIDFIKSVNRLNKHVNLDLKNLTYWLNANKIALNVEKTELVIFKHQRKKLDSPTKIKINRKRLYPSKSVKYLGIKIESLNLKKHIYGIAIKSNRANALLYTIRNFLNRHILRTIYFAIFDTHLNYGNLIWDQYLNTVSRIVVLQKKALRIMNFHSRDSHSSPIFKSNHILKLENKILIENILFISKSLNSLLPPIFKNWFTFCSDVHNYQTVLSTCDKIFKPSNSTDSFEKNSINIGANIS